MASDLETFERDFKAARDRLRPLGRRGWEAKRAELHRSIAQLENYSRLSKAQETELADLSVENQAVEALITEDEIAHERQLEAIRASVKAGTVATEGGADGSPITSGRLKVVDDDGAPWIRQSDGRKATVSRSQAFAEHEVVRDHERGLKDAERVVVEQHGSLGNLVRSMSTTSGAAIVPTIWAGTSSTGPAMPAPCSVPAPRSCRWTPRPSRSAASPPIPPPHSGLRAAPSRPRIPPLTT